MPNHQPNPINPYLAQPLLNKRKNATQACDSCRRRKRQCDAQRPVCSSCQKATLECTYNRNGLKRGPKTNSTHRYPATCTTLESVDSSSADIVGQYPENISTHRRFTSMDPFSREVTDHLVELFFEHCFRDFDFFSPADFLRRYVQDTINQDLLYAVCASGAAFSDHPAIAKTPPSSNGQIYVDRVKARMIHLISQVSVDVVHTLMILARAEYDAGHAQKGFRLEAIATAMVPELGLHRLVAPEKPFQSETERIAFEVGIRTFAIAATYDWFKSLVWGMPGMLDHIVVEWPTTGFRQGWWIEREPSAKGKGQQWTEPLDSYSIRILHDIHRPRRLKGVESKIHLLHLVDVGRLVGKVCQSVSSLGYKEDQHSKAGEGVEGTESIATPTKVTASRNHSVEEEYRQAQDALEHWRATLPQDLQPSRAKDMVSRLETYGFVLTGYYYALVIQLHRPFLLKACVAISSRKKRLAERAGLLVGDDVKEELERRASQSDLQMLESCLSKCLAAADGMLEIMEQFTEEDIRFRGYAFTFPIFIAGTVYIIQRTVNEASIGSQPEKDKLALCRRFLQTVGPYYASAIDEDLLLGRLSSGSVTSESGVGESTGRTSSSTIEVLSDFVLSTPPMDAVDTSDFEMMWLEGLTVEEAKEWKMSPPFVPPVEKDMQPQADDQDVEVEEDGYSAEWTFEPQSVPNSDKMNFSLTTTTTASTRTVPTTPTMPATATANSPRKQRKDASADGGVVEEEHAFFTTDSGLKTFWMHPEKMASLEEATILSFEKLSMLDQRSRNL